MILKYQNVIVKYKYPLRKFCQFGIPYESLLYQITP